MYRKLSFLIVCLGLSGISHATIWVGGDANCDYNSIQPALDDLFAGNETNVYIANNNTGNGVYTENLTIVNNQADYKFVVGGYDQCEGAITETNTEINGNASGPVINISGDDSTQSLYLQNLSIKNGLYDNDFHAGGLNIEDNSLYISLTRLSISNNQGYYGGGIYSNGGSELEIRLYNTLVYNNIAEYGGGMYCLNAHYITIWDRSGIAYNAASSASQFAGDGGGIYMAAGCEVRMSSGNVGFSNLEGIVGNTATGNGGGSYVTSGSELVLRQAFGNGKYVVYEGNIADFDNDGQGDGGAIYITGNKTILRSNFKDIIIKDNSAVNGGAIAATNGANAYINTSSPCSMKDPCILFSGNKAGQNTDAIGQGRGGTFHVNDASIYVSRVAITDAQADFGVVAYVENNGTIEMEFSVIHNNGETPSAQFDQSYLLITYSGQLKLSHVTVTDNTYSISDAMFLGVNNADLTVNNSIIQGVGYDAFEGFTSSGTSLDLTFKCNVMHEDASLGTSGNFSDNTVTTNPGFINHGEQDYRLLAGSISVDKCDEYYTTQFTQVDFEGNVTGVDDLTKANVLGTYDAGAYESYQWDVIFENNFE